MDILSPTENKFGFLRAQYDSEYYRKHFDKDLFIYSGPTISHYTDLNGLHGIVDSGGFWLSDHRFLNDKEEFENGRKLTKCILERLSKKELYKEFREVLKKTISELVNFTYGAYYVCSFSKIPDSLDQWRFYGLNGQGVSITFDNTKPSFGQFVALPIMRIRKVIYGDNEKTKIILRKIRKHNIEFKVDQNHNNTIETDDWATELTKQLAIEFINFKHPEYSSEQEVRLVTHKSELESFSGLKHRVVGDRIVPYIESQKLFDNVHSENEPLPIVEVRVGPAVNQEITAQSIEEYLSYKGYDSVKVIKSDVPYRG